jgi:hypothetical protein
MNFLKRWARITPDPKPLWKWVFIRGAGIGLVLMVSSLIYESIYIAKESPEGMSLQTLLSAALTILSDIERLRRNLLIYVIGGFFLGLLMWVPAYKHSVKVNNRMR